MHKGTKNQMLWEACRLLGEVGLLFGCLQPLGAMRFGAGRSALSSGPATRLIRIASSAAPAPAAAQTLNEALRQAVDKGDAAAVQALLDQGADANATDRGMPILMWAAGGKQAQIVKSLLAHGAKVNGKTPDGDTPLLMATSQYDPAVVQALLDAGAEINDRILESAVAFHHLD